MKKVIAFSLLISFIFALSGCYLDTEYEFMYDASEIERIEIVELLEFDSENRRYNENIIVTIDNTEEFLQEFSEIHCEKIFGEPCMVESHMIVIKVTYLNGNYELINHIAQSRRFFDIQRGSDGFFILDQKQFNELIKKYTKVAEF